jgi:hypothetical protein|tara:strand:- start:104 stop:283 length:180 start_codon:yes stop_codon:yes gene_type:complete
MSDTITITLPAELATIARILTGGDSRRLNESLVQMLEAPGLLERYAAQDSRTPKHTRKG